MENSDIEKDCIENNNANDIKNKNHKNDKKNKNHIYIDNNKQTKKLSFNVKAIHEIIGKIENRVYNIDVKL